ncbi:MAG TPA: lipocalin family protein [Chloroflexota bacterium]|nr:lipocalin family protein [Chloroflexota bacterium]
MIARLLLCISAALVLGCVPGPAYPPRSTPVPRADPTATPTPRPVAFPRDDGPHRDLTEWWYYTGHLDGAGGGQYGFELVVFQSVRGSGPVGYAAHFAVSDLPRGRFAYDERTSIGSQVDRAGADGGFDLVVGGWRMRGADGRDQLFAQMDGYGIDLALTGEKPPALHHGVGVISFGPAGDSYYYSRTRMSVTGTLTVGGAARPVTGVAWMDHQWGNFISAGGGWDWFSIHFDDRTELTGSVVRGEAGEPVLVYGTYVDAEGRAHHLAADGFQAEALGSWTSPKTGATYPSGWRIRTAAPALDLELTPLLPDQELDTRASTGTAYWEGAVKVGGSRTGRGYVELTGRAPRVG